MRNFGSVKGYGMKWLGKVCDWAFIIMWLSWMMAALVVFTYAGILSMRGV